MKKNIPVLLLAAVLLIVLLGRPLYVVNEFEQVIILRFQKPVGNPISTPGLKLKVPFIDQVSRFDRRFLEWSGEKEEVPTRDKVFIEVDMYARWRITDPLRYLQSLVNERGAQSRLDTFIDGETRNAVARHDLREVIRSTNRVPQQDESAGATEEILVDIEVGRDNIRQEILTAVQRSILDADLGIEILDVRFRRIDYGEAVKTDVYRRMISERQRISDRFRSEGEGQKAEILGEMDRDLKRIESEAYRTAQEIVGRADAEATDIFAQAYNQSADSRQFYQFLKTMETFRTTVDERTSLLLSTDGDFFQFLKGANP